MNDRLRRGAGAADGRLGGRDGGGGEEGEVLRAFAEYTRLMRETAMLCAGYLIIVLPSAILDSVSYVAWRCGYGRNEAAPAPVPEQKPLPAKETWINIVYTGKIYEKQDHRLLFQALAELRAENPTPIPFPQLVSVEIYGEVHAGVLSDIRDMGLVDIVTFHGRVSHDEAIQRQREARVLWLMRWEDNGTSEITTGKVFEYLAARRPILVTGGHDDELTRIVKDCHAGPVCPDVPSIKYAIESLY